MSFYNVKKKTESRRPISYRQSRAGLLAEALARKRNDEAAVSVSESTYQDVIRYEAKVEQAEMTSDFRFDFAVSKKE